MSSSLLSPRPRPVPVPVPVPLSPLLLSPRPFRPRHPHVISLSSTLHPPYKQGLVAVVAGLPRPRCGRCHGRGRHPIGAPTTPTQADARCGGAGAGLVPLFPRLGLLPLFSLSSSRRPFHHRPFFLVVVPVFSSSPRRCRPCPWLLSSCHPCPWLLSSCHPCPWLLSSCRCRQQVYLVPKNLLVIN